MLEKIKEILCTGQLQKLEGLKADPKVGLSCNTYYTPYKNQGEFYLTSGALIVKLCFMELIYFFS